MRRLKQKLRYPLTALFLAVYLLYSYVLTSEEVHLPEPQVPLVFYANQLHDNLEETLESAIDQATESIVIMIYSFSDTRLMQALSKKAVEGVSVRIIHDPVATQNIAFKLGPKVTLFPYRHKGLMHHKIIVIDHKTVWFGSANFTRDAFFVSPNIVVGCLQPELARHIEAKAMAILHRTRYAAKPVIGENYAWYMMPDTAPQALERLISTIETAQKSIRVAMYTFTSKPLIQALIAAKKRGVEVEVVLDPESAKTTSNAAFIHLKQASIKTYLSTAPGLFHYKCALIDERIFVVGSANWTKAAFGANDDNISFISNLTKEQSDKIHELWETIMQHTKQTITDHQS